MASVAAEQEEEVGVAVKKFSWQKAVWGPTHRVISATDAQYRFGDYKETSWTNYQLQLLPGPSLLI